MPDQDMFAAMSAAQNQQPNPGAPAGPTTTDVDEKAPVREISINDKQPDGSELKVTLKGDEGQNDRMQFLIQSFVDSGDTNNMQAQSPEMNAMPVNELQQQQI